MRWAKGHSPDGQELWLNWAASFKGTKEIIAHFQAGVKANGEASIGYVVGRELHGQGLATEGLRAVFKYLQVQLKVCEVKAWSDSRNQASHRVAEKLGMSPIGFLKDADFFKDATSDEFIFSSVFLPAGSAP